MKKLLGEEVNDMYIEEIIWFHSFYFLKQFWDRTQESKDLINILGPGKFSTFNTQFSLILERSYKFDFRPRNQKFRNKTSIH